VAGRQQCKHTNSREKEHKQMLLTHHSGGITQTVGKAVVSNYYMPLTIWTFCSSGWVA